MYPKQTDIGLINEIGDLGLGFYEIDEKEKKKIKVYEEDNKKEKEEEE